MDMPLVSVIITTYHNEQYLPRAIGSVLAQTYPKIELIVVDDNPPDSPSRRATEAVMARYPQVLYLRHPENRNGAAARNTGIRAAQGKYIAFLDNDDFYFSEHIASCVRLLRDRPDCGGVVCGVMKICGGICWDRIDPPQEDMARALLFHEAALGTGSNLFVTAATVRTLGGFDERFRRHQDVEFGLRYFALDRAATIGQVQIVKEMDGFSNVPDLRRFLQTKELLWETFRPTLEALSPADRARYYSGQWSALLYAACKAGDRQQIRQIRSQLESYRPLVRKERVMLVLTRCGLFRAYEGLKALLKRARSPRLKAQLLSGLPEQDRQAFQQALSCGKKEDP